MKTVHYLKSIFAAFVIHCSAQASDLSGAGIILYREPPSTYVELVRFNSLREAPVISTLVLPGGGTRQIRNVGVVARVDYPPISLHYVSEDAANATLATIQKVTTTYPEYHPHLEQIKISWEKALTTIRSNATRTPSRAAAATATKEPTLASLEINGIIYDHPTLIGADDRTASVTHESGVVTVPIESLTPAQIIALNQTSRSIKIASTPAKKQSVRTTNEERQNTPDEKSDGPREPKPGESTIDLSLAEARYTVGVDCAVIAEVIVRLAQAAGDNRLADFDRTLASVRRNRVDLFSSPTLSRTMALFATVAQLPAAQAQSIKLRGLPNLQEAVMGREMASILISGNAEGLETMIGRIISGLPQNPLLSAEMIEQRAFNLSERDRERCCGIPVFKRIGDMNGRALRERMARELGTNGRIPGSVIKALGGHAGMLAFLGKFVSPAEVTDRNVVLKNLTASYPTLPEQQRDVLASQIATQSELFLSNTTDLKGFGFQTVQDAEVAFAASSAPVSQGLVQARKRALEHLAADQSAPAEK